MAHLDEGPARSVTPTIGGETVELSKHSDITLSISSTKNQSGERRLVKFKLQIKALTTNSEYFSASLRFNSTNGHQTLSLKDDDIDAMYIWLLYMQVAKENADGTDHDEDRNHAKRRRLDTPPPHTSQEALFAHPIVKDASINTIWHLINSADKYLLDATILRGFFDRWYTANIHIRFLTADLARQVALPCYMFDHASGFADVTKWLAYHHEGHITEKRPDGFVFEHMRLAPPEFVAPMNHARGSLRTVIHRGIWDEIETLLRCGADACSCGEWASTAGHYFAGLVATNGYPLEKTFSKTSVMDILGRLKSFSMRHQGTCKLCGVDWEDQGC